MSASPPEPITTSLPKALEARHVAMISIGGIIGSGLFVGSSAAIAATGPVILISYLLAGVVMLFIMRMLGEMAVATPGAGSFTEYIRLGLGNWAGFIAGWLYWGFWVLAIALEAVAGASIIAPYVDAPVWQIGLVLLVAMSALNLLSTRTYGESEFWLSLIKVVAITVFIIIGAIFVFRAARDAGGWPANLYQHGGFAPFGPLSVFSGTTSVMLALVGAEIVTVAAAESKAPTTAIAQLTTTLIVRISIFFVASMFVIVCLVPWNTIQSGNSPFAMALTAMQVPLAPDIMNAVVVTAVLSCLNSGVYVSSRVLYTLSNHGEAPRWLIRANRRGVPDRAILLSITGGVIGVMLAAFDPGGALAFLLNATGAVMLVIYLMVAFAQIRYRRNLERSAPERLQLKTWWFPWSSYAVIAVICAVLLAMLLNKDLASQVYASAACFAIAALAYWTLTRRRRQPALEAAQPE